MDPRIVSHNDEPGGSVPVESASSHQDVSTLYPSKALVPISDSSDPIKRRRRAPPGCLTCWIRKVKCGEERPACKKCTSTGRTCEGYGVPPLERTSRYLNTITTGHSVPRSTRPLDTGNSNSPEHRSSLKQIPWDRYLITNTSQTSDSVDQDRHNHLGETHPDLSPLPWTSGHLGSDRNTIKTSLQSLGLTDPRIGFPDVLASRSKLPGDPYHQLLNEPAVERWIYGLDPISWLLGDLGTGKTCFMTALMQKLSHPLKIDAGIVLYFFCRSTDPNCNTTLTILRGLINILIEHHPQLLHYMQKQIGIAQPERREDVAEVKILIDVLLSMINVFGLPKTYIIIDGLDECEEDSEIFFNELIRLGDEWHGVKWLISSSSGESPRWKPWLYESILCAELKQFTEHGLLADFIKTQVQSFSNERGYDQLQRNDIQNCLETHADGSFLWIILICNQLLREPKEVLAAAISDPVLEIESLYHEMLQQVIAMPTDSRGYCYAILRALTTTKSSMQVKDLATSASLPEYVFDTPQYMEELVGWCAPLLRIQDGEVFFIHESAKEYFKKHLNSIQLPQTITKDPYSPTFHRYSVLSKASLTSLNLPSNPSFTRIQELMVTLIVQTFMKDERVESLYTETAKTFGRRDFVRTNSRFLKLYFRNLLPYAQSDGDRQAITMLHQTSYRELIAQEAFDLVVRLEAINSEQVISQISVAGTTRENRDKNIMTNIQNARLAEIERLKSVKYDGTSDNNEQIGEEMIPEAFNDLPFLINSAGFESYIRYLHHALSSRLVENFKSCIAWGRTTELQTLLDSTAFGRIAATDEFSWLQELRDIGYTSADLTQLILDDAQDSPWIYLETKASTETTQYKLNNVNLAEMAMFHKSFCVHQENLEYTQQGRLANVQAENIYNIRREHDPSSQEPLSAIQQEKENTHQDNGQGDKISNFIQDNDSTRPRNVHNDSGEEKNFQTNDEHNVDQGYPYNTGARFSFIQRQSMNNDQLDDNDTQQNPANLVRRENPSNFQQERITNDNDGPDHLDLRQAIAEQCGIAGVVPRGRDDEKWNGSVYFLATKTAASISYRLTSADHNVRWRHIKRIQMALLGYLSAMKILQQANLCCDGITIMRSKRTTNERYNIELVRIPCQLPIDLFNILTNNVVWDNLVISNCAKAAIAIIELIVPGYVSGDVLEFDALSALHIAALATQCLSIGILSYSQAHTGPLSPTYLMKPLRCVNLYGMEDGSVPRICLRLLKLSCLDGMVGDHVLVFVPCDHESVPISFLDDISTHRSETPRYDLITTVQEFVDTWDDCKLVFDVKADPQMNILAVEIAGGTIIPIEEAALPEDLDESKVLTGFHWASGFVEYSRLKKRFGKNTVLRIGSVDINTACPMTKGCPESETVCWQTARSCGYTHELGPSEQYWDSEQRQAGAQLGQYATVSFTQIYGKRPEKSLKAFNLEQDPVPIPFLEAHLGVQISLCTGVARRVPLSELLGQVIPAFLEAGIAQPYDWKALVDKHGFLEALRCNTYRAWINDPKHDFDLRSLASMIIRKVLLVLKDTGIDRSGENLVVAWAQAENPRTCVKIPCKKTNLWMRILADSVDCATFACITHHCLESESQKCRSLEQPPWHQRSAMLDTAVCRHTPTPDPVFTLEYDKPYWIGRQELCLLARAIKTGPDMQPKLLISVSRVPASLQDRAAKLSRIRLGPTKSMRIRERQWAGVSAEQVLVLDAG